MARSGRSYVVPVVTRNPAYKSAPTVNYYARAAGGNWSAAATWSTDDILQSAGAAASSAPTVSDAVFLVAGSGNVTADAGSVCRALDCTGYTGTLTIADSATALTVGDGVFKLVAGMTLTLGGSSSTITFAATTTNGGSGWNITTAGKTMPVVTFNGAGGQWTLQDALTATAATITLTAGSLNTNNQTVTCGAFVSSNSNVRSLTLGTSTVNVTTGRWNLSTNTDLTLSAASSTIVMSSSDTFFPGGNVATAYGTVSLTGGSQTLAGGATGSTIATLNRVGTASKTDLFTLDDRSNPIPTITTALKLQGNSSVDRLLVLSVTLGTAAAITLGASATCRTAGTANVDVMDITMTGGAANERDLSAITGLSGDCQGNTGITFTTAVTQTHTATAGGSWSDATKWTSRVPLPQDDVVVGSGVTGTLVIDMPRIGKSIDMSAFTGATDLQLGAYVFGGLKIQTAGTGPGAFAFAMYGRGSYDLYGGVNIGAGMSIGVTSASNYTLRSAWLQTSNNGFTINAGTFDSLGFAMSLADMWQSSGTTWASGGSTVTITATGGQPYNCSGAVTGSPTIILSGVSTGSRTFSGNSQTYAELRYTVANSPGTLVITGTNTFGILNVGPGRTLSLPTASSQTVTTPILNGQDFDYQYLPGVGGNYISVPDSVALSITGDLDIRVRYALNDWTPSAACAFLAKWDTGQRSYDFWLQTNGLPAFNVSADGTASTAAFGDTGFGIADGATAWVRVTWRASDGRVQFFKADGSIANPVAADFTQVGSNSSAVIASIFNSTAVLEIGSDTGGVSNVAGKLYRAQVRDGIDGTVVLDANFVAKAVCADSFTESSAQAATVTINGATAKVGDGRLAISGDMSTPSLVAFGNLVVDHSDVTGGPWYAATPSVNGGSNTGWTFGNPSIAGTQATTTANANAGSKAVTIPGGQATETDTANAGSARAAPVGSRATETDTANAGTLAVARIGIQATEIDTPNAGAATLVVVVAGSQATEADSANTGAARALVAGAAATETDTANPGALKLTGVGTLSTETDTANSGAAAGTVQGQRASETDAATTGAALVVVAGASTTETDTANAGTQAEVTPGTRGTETDTANAGTARAVVAGATATEIDTANTGTVPTTVAGAQVNELDTTTAGQLVIRISGALSGENDTAASGFATATVPGAQTSETDSANSGAGNATVVGAQVTETDVANAGSAQSQASNQPATETDAGNSGSHDLAIAGSRATETDTAQPGTVSVVVVGNRATETDTANAGAISGVTIVGAKATETDTARPGSPATTTTGARATETDTAAAGAFTIKAAGARATETDTGQHGTVAAVLTGTRATDTETVGAGAPRITAPGTAATSSNTANGGTVAATVHGHQATQPSIPGPGTLRLTLPGQAATETNTTAGGAPGAAVFGGRALETDLAVLGQATGGVLFQEWLLAPAPPRWHTAQTDERWFAVLTKRDWKAAQHPHPWFAAPAPAPITVAQAPVDDHETVGAP